MPLNRVQNTNAKLWTFAPSGVEQRRRNQAFTTVEALRKSFHVKECTEHSLLYQEYLILPAHTMFQKICDI